jgi:hypothetical protein
MSRLRIGLVELLHWLWLVAKKWVWLIALLPEAIDITTTYVPWLPQMQISWQWSVVLGCFGVLASAYLVHLDFRARLAAYEEHEPHYELQLLETSNKLCSPDQIHVELKFRVIRKNPWPGALVEISLDDTALPSGFGSGLISSQVYKPLDWHCYNPLKLPYVIPPAGCDLQFTIHYPIAKALDSQAQKQGEQMTIRVQLLIGYETQPLGYVQKCECLNVPVDLGRLFEDLVSSRTEDAQ